MTSVKRIILFAMLSIRLSDSSSNCTRSGLCREELEQRRIHEIKKTILEGLGMSGPPKINRTMLPSPAMKLEYQRMIERMDAEDNGAYSNAVTTFVPAEESNDEDNIARFNVADDLEAGELLSASLMFSVQIPDEETDPKLMVEVYQSNLDGSQTMLVSDTMRPGLDRRLEVKIPTAYIQSWATEPIDGIFVRAYLNGWNTAIHPAAATSEGENMMLKLEMEIAGKARRSIAPVCLPQNKIQGCCLYDLMVEFEHIGWEWIIAPPAYNAHVCKGDCSYNAHHFQNFDTGHARIMKAVIRKGDAVAATLKAIPSCCHPAEYDSMRLVYINRDGRVSVAQVHGMSVRRCSCT